MFFNEKSGLVAVWARLVQNGYYNREQVPKLLNLREEVYKKLDANAAEK